MGISLYGKFNRYFDADISVKLSRFVWCKATDNHILRDLVITEDLSGGFYVEPCLLFSFTPKDWFKLSFSAAYKNIWGSRGDSLYKEPGLTVSYKNIAGAGYSAFDIGIITSFRIKV